MSTAGAVGAVAGAVHAIAVAAARDPAVFRSRHIRRATARLVASLMLADDRQSPRVVAANAARLGAAAETLRALGVDPREVARAVGVAMVEAGTREGVEDGRRLVAWSNA